MYFQRYVLNIHPTAPSLVESANSARSSNSSGDLAQRKAETYIIIENFLNVAVNLIDMWPKQQQKKQS